MRCTDANTIKEYNLFSHASITPYFAIAFLLPFSLCDSCAGISFFTVFGRLIRETLTSLKHGLEIFFYRAASNVLKPDVLASGSSAPYDIYLINP